MPAPYKLELTSEQVIEKLTKTKGNLTRAARELRVSRYRLYVWMENYPEVKEALADIRESTLDDAETMLQNRMKRSDTLLIFFLKTQGHRRGYTERYEVGGANQGPIQHEVNHGIDGATAATIFDVLASVGAIPTGADDAKIESVDSAQT